MQKALRDYARHAFERGVAVTKPDGTRVPIGISATPVVLPRAEIVARATNAARLTAASVKAAAWRWHDREEHARIVAALSPAELRLVAATAGSLDRLAVARVDYLPGASLAALEVNATIPAMQGYSDIAVESWLDAHGVADVARWRDANGSNAGALLDALRASFDTLRPGVPVRTLALLCRRGDAQVSELRYLAARFGEAGVDARVVHPDELSSDGDALSADGVAFDLVYRHLFVHRLDRDPCAVFEAALANWRRTVVLNPPAPQVEMKSTLAVLSAAVGDDAFAARIGLDADERDAIRAVVPWTRRFARGPAVLPDGEAVPDLVAAVAAEPSRYVLKRAWSYGGHGVFVGRSRDSDDFATRVGQAYPGVRDWATLAARVADDAGEFVVQAAVEVARTRHTLCLPDAVRDVDATVDYSAYASVMPGAARPVAWSGVCRAATSDIVNIVGGGAVVPLVTREVYDAVTADGGDASPRSPSRFPGRSA